VDPSGPSERWRAWRDQVDLDEYDRRWERLADAGEAIHGEADAVVRIGGRRVLDAGCGTGRVAIELAARGLDVVGVDNDPDMIERARVKSDTVEWIEADLAAVDLGGRTFDVIVLAGNILLFVEPGSEPHIIANLAPALAHGGALVVGNQTDADALRAYDAWCADAGLELAERWSTWEGHPYDGGSYAVSIHRRTALGTIC
jgi:SAM-dependent methyltransferase